MNLMKEVTKLNLISKSNFQMSFTDCWRMEMRITVFQQMDLGEKFKKCSNFQEIFSDLYGEV